MKRVIPVLSCIVLGMLPPHLASAAEFDSYTIGPWKLAAYTSDQTQQFHHCAAIVPYKSGISMLFWVGKDLTWSVGFVSPAWQLQIGSHYDVALSIDGGPPIHQQANAITITGVEIPLAPSAALFERFRHGYSLKVAATGQVFEFTLDGSSRVLASLVECVQRHNAIQTSTQTAASNPFAVPARPAQPQSEPSDGLKAEANAVLANLLSAAGIPEFYILPPKEVPVPLASAHAVWKAGGVFGTLNVIGGQASMADAPSQLIAGDARACKGKFASGSLPNEGPGIRVFTACETASSEDHIYYLMIPRRAGGFYNFATVVLGKEDAPAQRIDSQVRDAALRTLTH
jgi:hypothetical protein